MHNITTAAILLIVSTVFPTISLAQSQNPERRGLNVSHSGSHESDIHLLNTQKKSEIPEPNYIKAEHSLLITDQDALSFLSLKNLIHQLVRESAPNLLSPNPEEPSKLFFKEFIQSILHSKSSKILESDSLFDWNNYKAIGAVNRFDLANDKTYETCGEYRLIFAFFPTTSSGTQDLYINFEMELPNPHRELGLKGCSPITTFWADLSNPQLCGITRGQKLAQFFHRGVQQKFKMPPISLNNLGGHPVLRRGQIRIAWQTPETIWLWREFTLSKTKEKLEVIRQKVKGSPKPRLFGKPTTSNKKQIEKLLRAIETDFQNLTNKNIHKFTFSFPDELLAMEGSTEDKDKHDIQTVFANANANREKTGLWTTIANKLKPIEGQQHLTVQHVITRINALSCAGCHRFVGEKEIGFCQKWQKANKFVHVSKEDPENGHYNKSLALMNLFLPFRLDIFRNHLLQIGYVPLHTPVTETPPQEGICK